MGQEGGNSDKFVNARAGFLEKDISPFLTIVATLSLVVLTWGNCISLLTISGKMHAYFSIFNIQLTNLTAK